MDITRYAFRFFLASLVMAVLAFSPPAGLAEVCASGDASLVAHWTFDDGAGSSAADSSGLGNDGTLLNGAGWTGGRTGNGGDFALALDGVNDYVSAGSDASLDNLSALTYSAWVFPTATGDREIFSKASSTHELRLKGSGTLRGCIVASGDSACSDSASGAVPLNVWTHVAMTYDHAGDRQVHLYVSGVEVSYTVQSSAGGNLTSDAAASQLLGRRQNGSRPFAGFLDEMRIYDTVLDLCRIEQLAEAEVSGCLVDADCNDGAFCNGFETCNVRTGICELGTAPACDDGFFCNGTETCNEGTDSCEAGTPPLCDDGDLCTGAETCNETTDSCDPGAPVTCNPGEVCEPTTGLCESGSGCAGGAASLVAHWTFDDGAGSSAADSSGLGNDGTLLNGAGWTGGRTGSGGDFALALDGFNDYVSAGSDASLDNLSALTYSAWVFPTATGDREIFSKASSTHELRLKGSGTLRGCIVASGDSACSDSASGAVPVNVWTHVAMTYDHAGDRQVHLYVGGVEVSYAVQSTAGGNLTSDAAASQLLGGQQSGRRPFAGFLDEMRIYDTVLDLCRIEQLAEAEVSGCLVDADCNDGAFCNGFESCNVGTGICETGTAPACDDGFFCNGTETCNEGTDSCQAGTPPLCDDGDLCTGAESCNETTDSCDPGAPVTCNPGEVCEPTTGLCESGSGCAGGAASLVAHWTFDEGAGSSAADSSGLGNDGTLLNGAGWTGGHTGDGGDFALALDGVNDYVSAGSDASLDNLSALTYSAWVFPTATGDREIFSKASSTRELRLRGFGTLRGCIAATGISACSDSASGAVPLNVWTHVAMTYDHAGDRQVHLYIGGVEVSYAVQSTAGDNLKNDAAASQLLGRRQRSRRQFAGFLDEMRIYNTVLDPCRIEQLAEGEVAGCPIAPDPTDGWATSSPEDQGMDSVILEEAVSFAQSSSTPGSGIIVRNGVSVREWGSQTTRYDLKSTTKSIGSILLGRALQADLVTLDDLAQTHLSTVGTPPANPANWLDDLRLWHLATHTGGFEKTGGFGAMLAAPGSEWSYSDGGTNWLADVLTVMFGQDLQAVLQNQVLDQMGITYFGDPLPDDDWFWRPNAYRGHTLNGIDRREFGSGISANVDTLARIGYLFLKDGLWDGGQLLPSGFANLVSTAYPPASGLPTGTSCNWGDGGTIYGVLWWTNADGGMPGVPVDAYFSYGLHDSHIVVIPSLKIIAARAAGVGGTWGTEGSCSPDWREGLTQFVEPIVRSAFAPCGSGGD